MNDRTNPSDYGGQTITDDSNAPDERRKSGMDGDQMNDRGRAQDSGDESGDDDSQENIDESDD